MPNETKHTPTPWQLHDDDYCPEEIYGGLDFDNGKMNGVHVADVRTEPDNWEANGRFIVRAVNSHDDLLGQ